MRGEGFDGVLAQVDQRHVFPVIGFEITVVQDEAFGSEKINQFTTTNLITGT